MSVPQQLRWSIELYERENSMLKSSRRTAVSPGDRTLLFTDKNFNSQITPIHTRYTTTPDYCRSCATLLNVVRLRDSELDGLRRSFGKKERLSRSESPHTEAGSLSGHTSGFLNFGLVQDEGVEMGWRERQACHDSISVKARDLDQMVREVAQLKRALRDDAEHWKAQVCTCSCACLHVCSCK